MRNKKIEGRLKSLALLFVGVILYLVCHAAFFSARPNIILISVDTLRPDHLGCYGYFRNTSPHIDAFAKHSTTYLNCFSAGSWTIPSIFSMLTSLYLPQHRVTSWNSKLDENTPTLLSEFRRHHYSIGIFGNTDLLLKNLEENFRSIANICTYKQNASAVTAEALRWITQQRTPFLAWIYYIDPHRPYTPPLSHSALFPYASGGDLPIQNDDVDYKGGWDYIPKVIAQDNIANLNYYIAQYDGEIHFIDEEIGRLLSKLKKMGHYDRNIIVLMSDHGESLGEHHLYFNNTWTLFNEVMKVPLIIKLPGQKRGRLYDEKASLIDIFPTLLRETRVGKRCRLDLEGAAIANGPPKGRGLFSYANEQMSAFLYQNWKLIEYPDRLNKKTAYIKNFFPAYPVERYQLFNMTADPAELNDLKASQSDNYVRIYREYRLQKSHVARAPREPASFALNEEDGKKLHSLGYVQ